MANKKKSWQEKLNVDKKPVVEKASKDFGGVLAGQMMLIPTPKLVDAYIRQIPRGKSVDSLNLRKDLAIEHNAEVTCPLTTGIFLRIVSEAAYEEYMQGKPLQDITPFWRVVDENSSTAKKLSFGKDFIREMREKEKI